MDRFVFFIQDSFEYFSSLEILGFLLVPPMIYCPQGCKSYSKKKSEMIQKPLLKPESKIKAYEKCSKGEISNYCQGCLSEKV